MDLGVKSLAVLSNHKEFAAVQPLRKSLSKLRRLQRKLARSEKGSKNRVKVVLAIGELHRKIFNYRQNALHQLTNYLTTSFSRIVIEDLNVSGLLKNGKLSRCIADVGFYEFRRQLMYKA
ncbi:MAG TPA: transposase [Candidatus Aphodousia gallistercoris]|nr:transposase [Candidatus Aphodousia gallistercoris]